ncbi:MAG: hypothetical protein ACRDRR_25390 [Pseudonocardiaceae bacterium]
MSDRWSAGVIPYTEMGPERKVGVTATIPHRLRRALVPILVATSLMVLVSCSSSPSSPQSSGPSTRVVTDTSGTKVTVPVDVERVGEQFPAHTVITIMLGAGSKIAAITTNVKTLPFLQKLYPQISSLPELFPYDGTAANIEELLELQIDVVFAYNESYQEGYSRALINYR